MATKSTAQVGEESTKSAWWEHTLIWAAIFAALLTMILAVPVRAHGDASWIMQNPDTSWCCGPQDCHAYPVKDVKITKAGYLFGPTGETVPYAQAKTSIDDQYWACRYDDGEGEIRCFFAPARGA